MFASETSENTWIGCDSGQMVALEFAPDYLEGLKGRLLFQGAQKLFHSHINSLEHLDASWNFMDGACLRACVPACLRACVPACTRACILLFLEIAPLNIYKCLYFSDEFRRLKKNTTLDFYLYDSLLCRRCFLLLLKNAPLNIRKCVYFSNGFRRFSQNTNLDQYFYQILLGRRRFCCFQKSRR